MHLTFSTASQLQGRVASAERALTGISNPRSWQSRESIAIACRDSVALRFAFGRSEVAALAHCALQADLATAAE